MATGIKIRTSIKDGITTVRAILRHPMHTGFGIDEESGELVPAHYIKTVNVYHNETLVLNCDWSRAVSRNPYLSLEFSGARPGDSLTIDWLDNKGETDSTRTRIQ